MKKMNGLLAAVIFIILLFVTTHFAWAEEAKVILAFSPENISVKYGETFSMDVVTASPEENIYGAAYDVVFDPTVLQIVNVEEGMFLKEYATIFVDNFRFGRKNVNTAGHLIVGQAQLGQAPGVNGGGVLAKIVFKVITSNPIFTTIMFKNTGLKMAAGYYIRESALKTNFVSAGINQ